MAYVKKRRPWDSQPQEAVGLDWELARQVGLRRLVDARQPTVELVEGVAVTSLFGGSVNGATGPTSQGLARSANNVIDNSACIVPSWTNVTNEASALMVFQRLSTAQNVAWELGAGGQQDHFPFSNQLYTDAFWGSRWASAVNPPAGRSFADPVCVVITVKNGQQRIYWDGVLWYENTATGGFTLPATLTFYAGQSLATHVLHAASDQCWSVDVASMLGANPWLLYEPQTIPVPVPEAGGGTTISGNLGTAVASGHTANVNANRTIAGTLGTASATGLQGNVNANRTIAGALGVATASGLAGNVNANRTIAGSLGVAVASGLQGAVSNSNNTVIAGNLGVAVASGLAANVNANTTIAGNIGVAVASGFSGSVLNGGGQPELQHHGAWGAPLSQDKLRQMELESEAEMIEILAMLCGAGVIA